jgi:hypothetical protein
MTLVKLNQFVDPCFTHFLLEGAGEGREGVTAAYIAERPIL